MIGCPSPPHPRVEISSDGERLAPAPKPSRRGAASPNFARGVADDPDNPPSRAAASSGYQDTMAPPPPVRQTLGIRAARREAGAESTRSWPSCCPALGYRSAHLLSRRPPSLRSPLSRSDGTVRYLMAGMRTLGRLERIAGAATRRIARRDISSGGGDGRDQMKRASILTILHLPPPRPQVPDPHAQLPCQPHRPCFAQPAKENGVQTAHFRGRAAPWG